MRGHDVRVLQGYLSRIGLRTKVDGQYGPKTTRGVQTWERRTIRDIDGKVTPDDAQALRDQVSIGFMGGTQYREPTPAPAPGQPPVPTDPNAPAQPPTVPGEKATLGADGLAIAPESAPPEVKAMIDAANKIHDKRYRYGGGHVTKFDERACDRGCDCSGSMSYVLQSVDLLDSALDSTGFMSWGDAGKGQWVTTYAHGSHAYMIIAGLRFDTSGMDDGTRWDERKRSSRGYTVRHPTGL